MIQEYDGARIVDADGNAVGSVGETYVDDAGTVRFVEVKLGALFAKHKLIPTDDADLSDQGLRVPYTKDMIERSPDIPADADMLEGEVLDRVRVYYAGREDHDSDAGRGEAASVPAEETVESRETTPVSTGDQERGVREVGGLPLQPNQQAGEVRDLGHVVEVPIVEEVLVKQPVVKEIVRIRKRPTTEMTTATAEVRKENLEVDDPENVASTEDLR